MVRKWRHCNDFHVWIITHGYVTHMCQLTQIIIGSRYGFSPVWHNIITLTRVELLLIGPLSTNFEEIETKKDRTCISISRKYI